CRSDLPVRFGATPLRGGMPVPAGSNPSPAWPAGEGEALAWFFLFEPGLVDGVRINVGHANGRGTFRSFDFPAAAEFVSGSGASTSSASWVARLAGRADSLRTAQQPTPSDGGAGRPAPGSA